jgi:hypothetical protein
MFGYFFNYFSILNTPTRLVESPERHKHKFVRKFSGCRRFGKLASPPGKNRGSAYTVKLSHTNWAVMTTLIVKIKAKCGYRRVTMNCSCEFKAPLSTANKPRGYLIINLGN